MADDPAYDWWKNALCGVRGELTPGKPYVGFYRDKQRAIEIYRSKDGTLHCNVSSGFQPRHEDEIDGLFGYCSTSPISYEVYQRFMETGAWPEDISEDLDRARIGHNSALLHEQVQDEIETVIRAFAAWLKEIGEVKSEEEDKKGEEFKNRIMALGKQASESRVLLKKPFLEGGRLVDKTWVPIEEQAEQGKSLISEALTPYRVARQKIRDEEAALIAELIKESPVVIQVPHRQHRPKTGLRTTKVVVIDDLQKASAQLAAMEEPPEDFVEAVRSVAKRLIDEGKTVEGAHIESRKKA